jgi:hypothetical protein
MPQSVQLRRGVRSTATAQPLSIVPDIEKKVQELLPEATPFQAFLQELGKGAPPKGTKVICAQQYHYDHFANVTTVATGGAGYERFGRLRIIGGAGRFPTGSYEPGDLLYLVGTGQTVEVVITEDAALRRADGTEITVPTSLTGTSSQTRTNPDEVVVRVVDAVPFRSGAQHAVLLGRVVYEGQPYDAIPMHQDIVYDFNLVQTVDTTIALTPEQMELVENWHGINELTFQQKLAVKRLMKSVEYAMLFGERAVDYSLGMPKRYMGGILSYIRTNVYGVSRTDYNDDTKFEKLWWTFINQFAFRYNFNGAKPRKLALCGPNFYTRLLATVRGLQRTTVQTKEAGITLERYFLGPFDLDLIRTDTFRPETGLTDWCLVVDPVFVEPRVWKNYTVKETTLPNERVRTFAIEWAGSISVHFEETAALMAPVDVLP